jgi:hypothetical protein
MTCAHVLGLIDAGPLADYPRAHLDAAWRHASQCATCGRALETARDMTVGLTALPRPEPPADVTGVVLARIAQIERPHPGPARAAARNEAASVPGGDAAAWATSLAGSAAGLAAVLFALRGSVGSDLLSVYTGSLAMGLAQLPPTSAQGLTLAAGLLLYVVALLASVRSPNRRRGH